MKLKLMQVGEPVLRREARALAPKEIRTPEMRRLVELMRETMRDAPGVGLAAPQIGESIQLAVIEDQPSPVACMDEETRAEREREAIPFHVIVNPKITVEDPGPVEFFEGCLSLTGFLAVVPRALAVRVECLNERAEPRVIHARGWYARILQHEIDHLHGTLYIDRMHTRSFMSAANHVRYWQELSLEQVGERLGLTAGQK